MSRPLTLILAATTVTGGLLGATFVLSPATVSAKGPSPHIVAKPDSVMVNHTTHLTGAHFPAKSTFSVEECSEKNWIAPQDPCTTANAITVSTNGGGHFKATMTVGTCSSSSTPGFEQTCYIGAPKGTGVDTVGLEGAVAITVTGP